MADEYTERKRKAQVAYQIDCAYQFIGKHPRFAGQVVTVLKHEKRGGLVIAYKGTQATVSPFSLSPVTSTAHRHAKAKIRPRSSTDVLSTEQGIVAPVEGLPASATIYRNGSPLPPPPPPDAATLIRLAPVITTPYPEITWAAWFVYRFRSTCPRAERRALARSTEIVAALDALVTDPPETKQQLYPLICYIIARRDVATATMYSDQEQRRVLDALGRYGVPRPTAIRDITKMREVVEWSKWRWDRFERKQTQEPVHA